MIRLLIAIAGVGAVLVVVEFLRATKLVRHPETLRKLVHILTGVFAASWAFFLPIYYIQIISITLLLVVLVSKHFSVFRSVHNISRLSYGEELFPVGIFLCATLANSEWIYMAAILHLGLADGVAALMGMRRARRFKYKVFGQTKSLLGSATFYAVSLMIVTGVMAADAVHLTGVTPFVLLWLPAAVTAVESFAVFGTDNLLVPLLVVLVLNGTI